MAKRKSALFGGIDPGRKGFFALYDGSDIVESSPIPMIPSSKSYDLLGISEVLNGWSEIGVQFVILEDQRPMPREGPMGAFALGDGFGIIKMGLHMAAIPHEIWRPGQWKKEMKIPAPAKKSPPKGADNAVKNRIKRENSNATKAISISTAQRLLPNIDLRRTEDCRTPSSDKAEACLMAIFAYRKHGWIRA